VDKLGRSLGDRVADDGPAAVILFHFVDLIVFQFVQFAPEVRSTSATLNVRRGFRSNIICICDPKNIASKSAARILASWWVR
jgi:hypothetical protein